MGCLVAGTLLDCLSYERAQSLGGLPRTRQGPNLRRPPGTKSSLLELSWAKDDIWVPPAVPTLLNAADRLEQSYFNVQSPKDLVECRS